MKKLGLALASFVAVVGAVACQNTALASAYYLSGGLPSVSVNSTAISLPGQTTSLAALINYQVPSNIQCTLVSDSAGVTGATVGTGPCTWTDAIISPNPSPNYTISGGYVNGLGQTIGLLFGSGQGSPFPPYSDIELTPNPGVSGSISISGIINPGVNNPDYGGSDYGPINWAGNVQISGGSACASMLQNAINPEVLGNGTWMYATFTPHGGNLNQAETACGVDNFDWQQAVDVIPNPIPAGFEPKSGGPLPPTPFLDPVSGGYVYDAKCPDGTISASARTAYPFVFDPNGPVSDCFSLAAVEQIPNTLEFLDIPADPCLQGGTLINQLLYCGGMAAPPGASLEFTTTLVGVKNGQPMALAQGTVNDYFVWTDNFNGLSGGIPVLANLTPVDPGSGTGRITILNVDGVPVTEVPEPSTLPALAAASAALGLARRYFLC